jgi:hypothetical protein
MLSRQAIIIVIIFIVWLALIRTAWMFATVAFQ